ncbi:MAG: cell division protein ZapA [Bacteroidales bacterium]|nr:cell division protein ZapA [Bacteroidales bacterium]
MKNKSDDKLRIKVSVGTRIIRLQIDRNDEGRIRKAAEVFNEEYNAYSQKYSTNDDIYLLAMTGFSNVVKYLGVKNDEKLSEYEFKYDSVFISYSFKDRAFANLLNEALEMSGVETFLFEKDAPGGQELEEIMYEGINENDRLLFISSGNSIKSEACQFELTEGINKETKLWKNVLFPIHLDNYLFEVKKIHVRPKEKADEYWSNICALRKINSLDFSAFNKDNFDKNDFQNMINKLMKQLKKEK